MLAEPLPFPVSPHEPHRRSEHRAMLVSPAEEKLLERLRSFGSAMLVTLFVGGDGEPKELFAQEAQREVLSR